MNLLIEQTKVLFVKTFSLLNAEIKCHARRRE